MSAYSLNHCSSDCPPSKPSFSGSFVFTVLLVSLCLGDWLLLLLFLLSKILRTKTSSTEDCTQGLGHASTEIIAHCSSCMPVFPKDLDLLVHKRHCQYLEHEQLSSELPLTGAADLDSVPCVPFVHLVYVRATHGLC